MNTARLFAILTALLALTGLIYILAADSQAPITHWPYEAYQGLVFTLGWGFGVPENLAYVVAALVVISVLVACYVFAYKLARCVLRLKK